MSLGFGTWRRPHVWCSLNPERLSCSEVPREAPLRPLPGLPLRFPCLPPTSPWGSDCSYGDVNRPPFPKEPGRRASTTVLPLTTETWGKCLKFCEPRFLHPLQRGDAKSAP